MKIAAITRYKHGKIFELLQKLGWTQGELARRCSISPCIIGNIINLSCRPTEKQANAIQFAFGEAGEYIDVLEEWPDSFRVQKGLKREEVAEIPVENLLYSKELLALEFESTAAPPELVNSIDDAMSDLSEKEKKTIEDFMDGVTNKNTSKKLRVSAERTRQIQMKAFHKLRHPSRLQKLNCDKSDEIIGEQRRQAEEYIKEEKERQEKWQKEQEEKQKLYKLEREKIEAQLREERKKHRDTFRNVARVCYNDYYRARNCIFSTTGEIITTDKEEIAAFIRKFIDPEWRGHYADYTITHGPIKED